MNPSIFKSSPEIESWKNMFTIMFKQYQNLIKTSKAFYMDYIYKSLNCAFEIIGQAIEIIGVQILPLLRAKSQKLYEILGIFYTQLSFYLKNLKCDPKKFLPVIELETRFFRFCLQITADRKVKILPVYSLQMQINKTNEKFEFDYKTYDQFIKENQIDKIEKRIELDTIAIQEKTAFIAKIDNTIQTFPSTSTNNCYLQHQLILDNLNENSDLRFVSSAILYRKRNELKKSIESLQ